MNDFEQTELKDIVGPIPPDPPVPWINYTTGVVGIVVCIVVLILLGRYKWKNFNQSPGRLKKVSIVKLKKLLKLYAPNREPVENADLDDWWALMLNILKEDQLISCENQTLHELDTLFETNKSLNLEDRAAFRELVRMMDQHKYQGGLSKQERLQVVECFRGVLKIIDQI